MKKKKKTSRIKKKWNFSWQKKGFFLFWIGIFNRRRRKEEKEKREKKKTVSIDLRRGIQTIFYSYVTKKQYQNGKGVPRIALIP